MDDDALHASLDLVRRSNAKSVQFGYLDDDVPVEDARWWAHAEYRGARISVPEGGATYYRGPVEALEALAARLLDGALCRRCAQPIRLDDRGPAGCRWRRHGDRWRPGCGKPVDLSIPAAPR